MDARGGSRPSITRMPRPGCARCPPSPSCAGCGSKIICGTAPSYEAHYARKHTTQGVVYKVHITESCEDDVPHLITNV
jgi:hypothetical protein